MLVHLTRSLLLTETRTSVERSAGPCAASCMLSALLIDCLYDVGIMLLQAKRASSLSAVKVKEVLVHDCERLKYVLGCCCCHLPASVVHVQSDSRV